MIGWKPRPFIYIHIPKCAGTSIERALIPIATPYQDFEQFPGRERMRFWLPGPRGRQHWKIRAFERRFILDEYFKFAFVRNPWARAVSQIEYLRKRHRGRLFSGSDFKEHLRVYCQISRHVSGHDLGACQLDYLLGDSGNIAVDFIGRFESLHADFAKICGKLGIAPVPSLPHAMDSKRSLPYTAYFDQETRDWIKGRFAKDIDFFGYEFDDAVPRKKRHRRQKMAASLTSKYKLDRKARPGRE